jgi:hypothetical protein
MKYLLISVTLVVLLPIVARAQQPLPTLPPPPELECRVLTGRVTDPFAYPLAGAIIMLHSPDKGFSPEAFSTNSEGNYIVATKQAILRNTVLEITAVGYITMEVPLTSCKPLDLTMQPLNTSYKVKYRAHKGQNNGKVR